MIIIGARQETAEQRLDADNFKVLTADFITPDEVGGAVGIEPEIHDAVSGDGGEDGLAVTNITELHVREVCLIPARLKGHDFAGLGNVKRPQDESLEDTENDNVGSNAKREGGYGGDGEAWGTKQLADCKSKVLHYRL